jgi:hypothetical protein
MYKTFGIPIEFGKVLGYIINTTFFTVGHIEETNRKKSHTRPQDVKKH